MSNFEPAGVAQKFAALGAHVSQVIQGKADIVHCGLVCLLAEGHLLIEDVPGTGKTSLARSIAASFDLVCRRIQFTPDLLPSDVTGVSIYNRKTGDFEFRPGPVFANIVLADEINRASPKTQSALLEVMEENTVTTDLETHRLQRPFMVIATQNSIDMEGTYPLPEAQLDRFLMRLHIGYPDLAAEMMVLDTQKDGATVEHLRPLMNSFDLAQLIASVKQVETAPAVQEYVVKLADFTRKRDDVRLGVSPRGSLALLRAARAEAAAAGRPFVSPEDVKHVAPLVMAHRILLHPDAAMQGRTGREIVDLALQSVPVPREYAR